MITFYNPQTQAFLDGMNRIQQRQAQAQLELTTGLRINTVSDAPDRISDLLSVRSAIARNTQIGQNLASAKTETDTAESVLSNAVTLVERAQSLGTQGASDMDSAETRNQLAQELGSILTQLVNSANTAVGGRYIFGGDSDQTQPYAIDLTQTNPIGAFAGTVATRQVESPDGSSFAIAKTAQDIFDAPDSNNNVFMSINNLRNALLNNDSAGVNAAIAQVNSSDTYVNNMLSFYGTVQNRVASAITYSSQYDTQLRTQLSTIQDADETQSIIDLNQAQTQQQAALTSEAQIPRTSLFNFLG
ncbi:MAG: flagellin [Bryobacteraceae bacterium]|jgi:flagellar hook-associated protein 3 FlgL